MSARSGLVGKKSSWPYLGPSEAIFSMDRKNPKIDIVSPIFPWWPLNFPQTCFSMTGFWLNYGKELRICVDLAEHLRAQFIAYSANTALLAPTVSTIFFLKLKRSEIKRDKVILVFLGPLHVARNASSYKKAKSNDLSSGETETYTPLLKYHNMAAIPPPLGQAFPVQTSQQVRRITTKMQQTGYSLSPT